MDFDAIELFLRVQTMDKYRLVLSVGQSNSTIIIENLSLYYEIKNPICLIFKIVNPMKIKIIIIAIIIEVALYLIVRLSDMLSWAKMDFISIV